MNVRVICKNSALSLMLAISACVSGSTNVKVGPDDVDVEKEKARYRAYFQKIVFALETGSFFDVEVKEKDPWGRALIVEHCESGTTYRSQGLSVEDARDDIVVRSFESSIHASFRYHDANGSCDIFFD